MRRFAMAIAAPAAPQISMTCPATSDIAASRSNFCACTWRWVSITCSRIEASLLAATASGAGTGGGAGGAGKEIGATEAAAAEAIGGGIGGAGISIGIGGTASVRACSVSGPFRIKSSPDLNCWSSG
jgi:hypothetical protein